MERLFGRLVVFYLVQIGAVLEKGGGVLDYAVVELDVVYVHLEELLGVFVQLLRPRDVDEGEQDGAHPAHDFVLLVEADLVVLVPYHNLPLLLVFVELDLLEDVDGVLLLLGLQEDLDCHDAVEQVVEVLLGLAGALEEVFLEFLVVVVGVLLVDLEGGEGELAAVDEGRLELVVS